MDLAKVARLIPDGITSYEAITEIIGPAIRSTTKVDVDAVLNGLEHYQIITRPVGDGGMYAVRPIQRMAASAPTIRARSSRVQSIGLVDEWGNTRDYPVGPVADAEIARVKEVRRRAERARLVSIMGDDV